MLAVAVIAGSVLCGSLLLIRSTEQAGVRSALASMSADRVDVLVRVVRPGKPVSDARAAADAATAQAYGGGARWSSIGWATTAWSITHQGEYSYLVEFDDPSAEAALVEGVWPSAPPGIAVPQSAAASLGLSVGDTVDLDVDDTALHLRIDGIYTAAPETGTFWENDPLLARGDAPEFAKPGTSYSRPVHAFGPLITARGGIDDSAIAPARLEIVEHPSFRSTDVAGLTALRERTADADIAIAAAVSHPAGELFVDTGLAGALDDVKIGLQATRSAAVIIALLMIVVVVMAASAVARLLVEAHAAESRMLLSRGASKAQRWQTIAVDAVAIAVIVAIISPWGGVLLHGVAAATPPLSSAGVAQWVLPTAAEWLCALGVAVIVGALVCLPPSTVRRNAGSSGVLAAAAGTGLVAVAFLLAWRVTSIDQEADDVLFVLTPAVLIAAITVIGSRLMGAAARPVAAATSRARGAVAPLAAWFAARGADRSTGVVLVALTVAVSVVTLGTSATWQQAVRDEAAVALGAPARAAVDAEPTSVVGRGSPVIRRQTLVSKQVPAGTEAERPSTSAQILGLDAAARAMLAGAAGAGAVSEAGGAAILDALPRSDAADTGPLLPPGTAALRARVALDAPEGVEATVAAVVEDSSGAMSVLTLGALTTSIGPTTLTSTAHAISSLGDSLRLVALTVRLLGGETEGVFPVTMTIDQLAALTSDGGNAVPVEIASAGRWAAFNDDDPDQPPESRIIESGIELSVAAQSGPSAITFGVAGWDPDAPIGAVLPAALADDLDVGSGAEISGFLAGTPVVFRVVGTTVGVPGAATAEDLQSLAAGLPSGWRSGSSVVVDGRALVHRLAQSSAFGPLVDEYWLTAASADAIAGGRRPAEGTTSDREALIDAATLARTMIASPLRAEIPATSVVTVWTCVLLALAGFGARAASVSRSRRLETAQLRAIGLSRRAMLGVAILDTGAIALSGIAIGMVAGWATLALVGTRIAGSAGGGSVDLVVPWQALVLLPLALIAALGAVSLGVAVGQRRLPLPELLRTGADG